MTSKFQCEKHDRLSDILSGIYVFLQNKMIINLQLVFLSVRRKCFPLNVQHLHIKQFVEVTLDHQSPCLLLLFARRCLDTILLLYAKKNIKLLHFSCTRSRFRTVLLITDYCAVFSKQASKDIKSQIEWACFTKHLSNWLNHAALERYFSVQQ